MALLNLEELKAGDLDKIKAGFIDLGPIPFS